jgi:hypothetical protein
MHRRTPKSFFVAAVFTWLAVLGGFWGCTGSELSPQMTSCEPEIAHIREAIFLPSCSQAGCHGREQPAATLDLTGEHVEGALVGKPSALCDNAVLVVPGDPEASLLYQKVTSPTCGARMPPAQALPAAMVECLKQWITDLEPADAGLPDANHPDGADGGGDGPEPCTTCGGTACVDTTTDPAHCGGCGAACPTGASCAGGTCECAANTTVCAGSCVDLQSDAVHCGDCGEACPAGTVCNAGTCAGSCGALTQCGASCVDTQTSGAHCGACDNPCPAGASCVDGACVCPAGTMACNGTCIDVSSSSTNCGACGKACAGGSSCQNGACVCPDGKILCGGVCTDTSSDPSHCGACGQSCAMGQSCTAGVCTCGTASVSFSGAVQPILTAKCAAGGCHGGVVPQGGINLSSGKSYASMVGVPAQQCNDGRLRVKPGDPGASYVVDKMTNTDICSGTQMPKTGLLPSAEIQTVVDWICQGAMNN